eukprot:TRINITY_DN1813_c1_g1_i1.p1 TRINITY_DN1813_c1_g1~~TRINITY_DN1813_c1_g1_i1.p1  ORF type:complete len:570 (+),score=121.52 TRINITY_DN1813_c1_g1_i1:135-1844(+)
MATTANGSSHHTLDSVAVEVHTSLHSHPSPNVHEKRDLRHLSRSQAEAFNKLTLLSATDCVQGPRSTMEDHSTIRDDLQFYAVFDGHGGDHAALLAKNILHDEIVNSHYFKEGKIEEAIQEGFLHTDKKILEASVQGNNWKSGTTAVVALISGTKLYIANCGDSEAVLGRRCGQKSNNNNPSGSTTTSTGSQTNVTTSSTTSSSSTNRSGEVNLYEDTIVVSPSLRPPRMNSDLGSSTASATFSQEHLEREKMTVLHSSNSSDKPSSLPKSTYLPLSFDPYPAHPPPPPLYRSSYITRVQPDRPNVILSKSTSALKLSLPPLYLDPELDKSGSEGIPPPSSEIQLLVPSFGGNQSNELKFSSPLSMGQSPTISSSNNLIYNTNSTSTSTGIRHSVDNTHIVERTEPASIHDKVTDYLKNNPSSYFSQSPLEKSSYDPVVLSVAHLASDAAEKSRISDAGGLVQYDRISGDLAVSRSFGDIDFKHPHNKSHADFVSVKPHVQVVDLSPHDDFLILASDGLWDVLSHQDAVDVCARSFSDPELACEELVDEAIRKRSGDNVTVVFLKFKWS